MDQRKDSYYAALKSKDTRFDGCFFVGVSSTGIYCRSICKARLPKYENCTFYHTAAEAEQAGYRPCMLCRPELAPGFAPVDSSKNLARKAAMLIEEDCSNNIGIREVAEKLGCSDRHLRRVFESEYHITLVQYRQTCRLLLSKNLLTDTKLSMVDIAMASGFGSLRRFNGAYQQQYHLSPSALRKQLDTDQNTCKDMFTIELGYRPPFQWDRLLDFFALRAIPGVEVIKNHTYYRTIHLLSKEQKHLYGWMKVSNDTKKNRVAVTVTGSLLPVLPQILGKVRHLFDLYCEPDVVSETLSKMEKLGDGVYIPGIRVPGSFDAFETSVRAVLGQQITVKAATTLSGRLTKSFGTAVWTNVEGLEYTFPTVEEILALGNPIENHLGPLGIIATRARTIQTLAEYFSTGYFQTGFCSNPEEELKKLVQIPGIGPWTANYIAMRTLGWTDGFPDTDLGVKKALAPRTRKEILALAESWRPWRAYATMCLWNLELGG